MSELLAGVLPAVSGSCGARNASNNRRPTHTTDHEGGGRVGAGRRQFVVAFAPVLMLSKVR
ncbi:GL13170 [Drosophila persimilis]|uniref:GL13170 n=1 Tax=Drosophila persimilis TaxID=7234 RepID=B4IS78_DROPE|nr:GL13170 [Drosophila persimilis]